VVSLILLSLLSLTSVQAGTISLSINVNGRNLESTTYTVQPQWCDTNRKCFANDVNPDFRNDTSQPLAYPDYIYNGGQTRKTNRLFISILSPWESTRYPVCQAGIDVTDGGDYILYLWNDHGYCMTSGRYPDGSVWK
jgi:hypothetical protein